MWINRLLEPRIKKAARIRPALVLTGSRQSGKTTLLRRLFPRYNFVSLDLPSEAARAENDPTAFLSQYITPLIIDEVQYAPKLFRHLKMAIDARRDESGLFLLTGSQKFSLMKEVSDSLAGRVELIELEPLAVLEIQSSHSSMSIEQIIVRGGYPELYDKPDLDSGTFYRSYIATYLERDVRQIINVSNLRDFERFLRAVALRSGQLLNKAELARDVGVSPSTAHDWLSVLQASNQVQLLEPWFSNRTKSLVKTPKLYVSDTGVLCALLNIKTQADLLESPYRGAIWETFVYGELRKRQLAEQGYTSLYFWRDKTNEIDFVSDKGGVVSLYEAKWSEYPDISETKSMSVFRLKYRTGKIAAATVVCRAQNEFPLAENIMARPVTSLKL